MKRILSVLLAAVVLLSVCTALGEGIWYCPQCGQQNSGNFCPNCGTARPAAAETPAEDYSVVEPGDTLDVASVNGSITLELSISFEKNELFSTYAVEMYLDDALIARLPHGSGYHGFLGVSEGQHILLFCKEGDTSVKGFAQFSVTGDMVYSCRIQAKRNKVKISEEKTGGISGTVTAMSREEYMAACIVPDYRDVERNPDSSEGMKIIVSGTVIQVIEGWFDTVVFRVRDDGGNIWYVTYVRPDGESRILTEDRVAIYGTCTGVKTYKTASEESVTIPSMSAKYIVMR